MKKIILPLLIISFSMIILTSVVHSAAATTVYKHPVMKGNFTQNDISFGNNPSGNPSDHIYELAPDPTNTVTKGSLTISVNNTGSYSGVVFVDGDLNITGNYTYGASSPTGSVAPLIGTVFVVKGDVNIHKDVDRIDAVIISNGTICTAFDAGICPGTNIVTSPLIINGSLISIKQPNPTEINPQSSIRFRRSLLDNSQAAERINHQVKYLVILRNLLSDTWQKWSEVP